MCVKVKQMVTVSYGVEFPWTCFYNTEILFYTLCFNTCIWHVANSLSDFTVDIVVFCKPSPLQLRLYRKLLDSRLIRSCLSGTYSGSPHLVCIAALKKLCNHPALLHRNAEEAAENTAAKLDEELVSCWNVKKVFCFHSLCLQRSCIKLFIFKSSLSDAITGKFPRDSPLFVFYAYSSIYKLMIQPAPSYLGEADECSWMLHVCCTIVMI